MPSAREFEVFMRSRERGLLRTSWLLTGSWTDAEDLTQTAMTKCWKRWEHLRSPEAADAYTRRIVFTTFLGWRRRLWINEIATGQLPEVADRSETESEVALRQAVIAAIRQLPPHQRSVVVLRFFADLTEESTANALGCSVGTVKSQNARALRKLREIPGLAAAWETQERL